MQLILCVVISYLQGPSVNLIKNISALARSSYAHKTSTLDSSLNELRIILWLPIGIAASSCINNDNIIIMGKV